MKINDIMINKICEWCNKKFKVYPSRSKQRFCCRKCTDKYKTTVFINDKSCNWKGGKITLICEQCNKSFEVYPYQKGARRFCCKKCMDIWQKESGLHKDRIGNKNHNWKGGKITLICEHCNKSFEVYPYQKDKQKYCSIKCRSESKITRQRISAGHQHISYDKWEEYAKNQLYCPDFNEECKESNRDKYDRMCFLTGLPEEKNKYKNDKQIKLAVHHVDMDKGQGCNGKRWKLVPLCLKWHSKVHNELWEARIIWLLDNVW